MTLYKALLLSYLALCYPIGTLAANNTQAIYIESDAAEKNQQTGLTQYIGNVLIRQGSLIINAHKVELSYQDKSIDRILSNGNPATFQQNNRSGPILASADTIEFFPESKLIQLKTNASLSKDGTIITGDSIHYDISNQTWRAKGDNQGNQKRIQLVIPPLEGPDKPSSVNMDNKDVREDLK